MKQLLSIAIPSNNKTALVRTAVSSILSDPAISDRCGIFISDNSITNDTEKYYADDLKENHFVNYRRSLDAPSLDENVNMAVSKSNSEYVWIFGDDDLLVPDVLGELLVLLEAQSPDIVILNSLSFQQSGVVEPERVPISEMRVYGPDDDDLFLSVFGGYLTYVPCIVVRKSLWESHFPHENIGSFFCHLETIFRIKKGRSAYYIPKPAIQMRLHFQTWVAKHFEIWNMLYPKVIWELEGYSDEAKRKVISPNPLESTKRILASRAYGRYNYAIWKEFIRKSSSLSLTRKYLYCLIAIIPCDFFRLLYIMHIRVRRNTQTTGFSPELALAQLSRNGK